ncbi:hypothetical protein IFM89_025178 [Coptis chinensis]|uniref:Enoyl reductase (ER) domain-containing protein n=1 Tax=Coptis chinensis TaxID=261450 RepID=A0A835HQ32_9MAGN|nr:hypothetical protein IFM89_025178 [Coptis chinensis]
MSFFKLNNLLSRSLVNRSCLKPHYLTTSFNLNRPLSQDHHQSNSSNEKISNLSGYHVSNGPSFMRGTVWWGQPNSPLTIEDFHMPIPKANELLIKTKACGVCHSDLHIMKGEIAFPSPCVVGHEITGEVVDHGTHTDPGIIKRLPVGSRVVGAFIMPCGNCFYCVKGQEDLCEPFFEYNRAKGTLYDGETRLFLRKNGEPVYMYSMGGLAEYCVVPAHALSPLPNSLPYTESAILGCAIFTAYGAMRHAADMRAGDAVAVIGIGGVGSSPFLSPESFVTGLMPFLFVFLLEWEITGGMGVDIAVEALGKPRTFLQCTQSVRDGGKAVMIGLAPTNVIGEVDITRLVRRQIKIIGSYGARARQDLPKLVKLAETGIFDFNSAISRKCTLEEVDKVFQDLASGSIVGRAVVEIM